MLGLLLRARDEHGHGMTAREVRDEAMTLFLGGLETSGLALAWIWYLLARRSDVRARVQAEVDRALAGRLPTFDDLPRLAFTLQVCKEGLRLYPSAYTLFRQALRPIRLGDFCLRRGDVVFLSPYLLHRRSDYFADPETFDPERWTPERERALPKHAYLPFGGGPRGCPGSHFALMELQIVLATLAQRVMLDLAPGQAISPPFEPLFTLRPKGGLRFTVTRRRG
jgi:cytochrome P450